MTNYAGIILGANFGDISIEHNASIIIILLYYIYHSKNKWIYFGLPYIVAPTTCVYLPGIPSSFHNPVDYNYYQYARY